MRGLWTIVTRLGERINLVLIGTLLIVLGTWAFIELADAVREGGTQRFDDWAVEVVRDPANKAHLRGPEWLTEVARDLTALGGMTVLGLVTLAVLVMLLLRRKYGTFWLVFVATLGGFIINQALKMMVHRPRPSLVPHLSELPPSASFPSGHSMLSATVYLTLGALLTRTVESRVLKIYYLGFAMLLSGLIGVSRVYMGVHYPTDVLAGWTAGLVWALLCWLIARHLQRRGAVEPEERG